MSATLSSRSSCLLFDMFILFGSCLITGMGGPWSNITLDSFPSFQCSNFRHPMIYTIRFLSGLRVWVCQSQKKTRFIPSNRRLIRSWGGSQAQGIDQTQAAPAENHAEC
ncbi:hypothetical protein BKA82DRAFT_434217 [Pisolithus tinctorius]|uniref:Uncharacterized protein n=1 Tax=Pisolithus tinctorius Marx 270 TaxID=870435 RepID=A0A0C3KAA2_PISTI|nr:hypothetical protein BKA82DRAFT_434217 [Pisolithus tinctorius]KIO06562.1 hypothetical protein M404DRAFT_434217 [Pisolithus tinctorius Marx 270]